MLSVRNRKTAFKDESKHMSSSMTVPKKPHMFSSLFPPAALLVRKRRSYQSLFVPEDENFVQNPADTAVEDLDADDGKIMNHSTA